MIPHALLFSQCLTLSVLSSHNLLLFSLGSIGLSFGLGRFWPLFALSFFSLSLSLSLNAARILSSSFVLLFRVHTVLLFLCREATFFLMLRSSVAAVTPVHPNQYLCPVCVGVQMWEPDLQNGGRVVEAGEVVGGSVDSAGLKRRVKP